MAPLRPYRVASSARWARKKARIIAVLLFAFLCAVLAAAAFTAFDAEGVERPADDVVPHAGQVAHAAAPHQYDAVLLKVVLFAGDAGGHFLPVAEPHAGDLPKGRVGL